MINCIIHADKSLSCRTFCRTRLQKCLQKMFSQSKIWNMLDAQAVYSWEIYSWENADTLILMLHVAIKHRVIEYRTRYTVHKACDCSVTGNETRPRQWRFSHSEENAIHPACALLGFASEEQERSFARMRAELARVNARSIGQITLCRAISSLDDCD